MTELSNANKSDLIAAFHTATAEPAGHYDGIDLTTQEGRVQGLKRLSEVYVAKVNERFPGEDQGEVRLVSTVLAYLDVKDGILAVRTKGAINSLVVATGGTAAETRSCSCQSCTLAYAFVDSALSELGE